MHTLILRLKMNREQTALANRRFYYMWRVHNQTVKHARKLLNSLKHSREYKALSGTYKAAKESGDDELRKTTADRMDAIRDKTGLTKGSLEKYASRMQREQYRKHLSSQQVQKEADRVWEAVEDVLFGDGKEISFKKLADFGTVSSKSMNGCHYCDPLHPSQYKNDRIKYPTGEIVWMGETIKVEIPWHDQYTAFSINHDIKYCDITRKQFNSGWHYYVILTLGGPAPVKHLMGKGTTGIDPGMSTMCAVSDNSISFDELAPRCREYDRKIIRLQEKLERSRRDNNPDNYNKDGTPKKGKHKWTNTKAYKKTQRQLRTQYRRKSDYTGCMHNRLANEYIAESDTFLVEEIDYRALARRSRRPAERQDKATKIKHKDGTVKEVRKFKKKRRFGKSVNDRSPGLFIRTLAGKVLKLGGTFGFVDTKKLKASQYRHDTGTCEKTQLSQRCKMIAGEKVYRDPYSAFIIKHCLPDRASPDRDAMVKDFKNFLEKQSAMVETAKLKYPGRPACFGF